MVARIPKACRKQGCPYVTTDRSGYCDKHRGCGWQRHQQGRTATQRGYGAEWRKLRAIVLERDRYLCRACLRSGLYVSATTVDHTVPKAHGGNDELNNLQSLCDQCHKAKTARERLKA